MVLRTRKIVVLSLGGSLITKNDFNISFLNSFKSFILDFTSRGFRFIIVCGGGKPARSYQEAASKLGEISHTDLDWLGIHATRLNAQLIRSLIGDLAEKRIVKNPRNPIKFSKPVVVAAGWKPGFSTDFDAILLASRFGVNSVVNLTGIQVHDKDPNRHADAKPIDDIRWKDFFMIVGKKWSPGLNMPFDPIASKLASRKKISVAVLGPDLTNLGNFILGKEFKGTIIR